MSGRRQAALVIGAVVATVLVALGAVALAGRGGAGGSRRSQGAGPVAGALVDAGDLGEVADAQALRQRVEPALPTTGTSGTAQSAKRTRGPSLPCEAETRRLHPTSQLLVYRAAARWQGTPAVLFGFTGTAPAPARPAGKPTPTRVYVMSRADCELLVFQSYAP